MRWWTFGVVILLTPLASAMVFEDAADDVQVFVLGEPQAAMQPDRFQATDIRQWSIEETQDHIWFNVTAGSFQETGEVRMVESAEHVLEFTYGGVRYRVEMYRNYCGDCGSPLYSGHLQRMGTDPDRPEEELRIDPQVDEEEARMAMDVPRELILDANGSYPVPGHVFEGIHAWAGGSAAQAPAEILQLPSDLDPTGTYPTVPLYDVKDLLGSVDTTYTVAQGGGVVHGLSLSCEEPYRMSNGEATTLLFETRMLNLDNESHVLHFSSDETPDGWDIWFPSEGLAIEGGEELAIPILVRMPFAHEHGKVQSFDIRVEDADDDTVWANVELGVRFTDPPQPSGHHSTVYIHGELQEGIRARIPPRVDGIGVGFMDTREDGPTRPIEPVTLSEDWGYIWEVPLRPGLGMGLVFEPAGTGTGHFDIGVTRPVPAATLHGWLVHNDASGTATILGEVQGTGGPVDIAAGSSAGFDVTFTSLVERVDYAPRAGLMLRLVLETADEATQTINLVDTYDGKLQGGLLDLPLREYHDQVDEVFADVQTLRLDADVREADVNPGEVLVFSVDAVNAGAAARTLALDVAGSHAEWATVTPGKLTLEAGARETVLVAVTIPEDALDGDVADLVLEAEGDGARVLLRLVGHVDADVDHEDMAALLDTLPQDKKSPAPPALGVLAVALLLRRMRR